MQHENYKSLYIHIPFCKNRCAYCDFATTATGETSPRIAEYIETLVSEIRKKTKEGELGAIETIYIGGGTPTHIGIAHLTSLLYTISVSVNLSSDTEFTLEANPESLTENMVKDIWALGVNRLSIGVQSFNNDLLKTLGRVHSADDARRAIKIAQSRFDNVSIDLMCGLPGQTFEDFQASLEQALALGVDHVSVYPLAIEPHTMLDSMVLSGEVEEVDQDKQAFMMQMAASILEPAGLVRYEVASYAKPGHECRHNMAYWTGKPYLGLGTSAVTMTQNDARRMRVQDGEVTDDLNRRQIVAEDLMLAMRMTKGVSEKELAEASLLLPAAPLVFRELVQQDFIKRVDARYEPTLAGWLCGNELFGKILDLAP